LIKIHINYFIRYLLQLAKTLKMLLFYIGFWFILQFIVCFKVYKLMVMFYTLFKIRNVVGGGQTTPVSRLSISTEVNICKPTVYGDHYLLRSYSSRQSTTFLILNRVIEYTVSVCHQTYVSYWLRSVVTDHYSRSKVLSNLILSYLVKYISSKCIPYKVAAVCK